MGTKKSNELERADRSQAFVRRGKKCHRQGERLWARPAVHDCGGRVQLDAVARIATRGMSRAPDAISLAEKRSQNFANFFSETTCVGPRLRA